MLNSRERKNLQCKLNSALLTEEKDTQQKAKTDWINLGDSNTTFFHAQLKKKKRRNNIKCLKKDDGSVVFIRVEIESEANSFFNNLLRDEGLDSQWNSQPRKVLTQEAQKSLILPFKEEELWEIISKSNPTKSPGLDGFNSSFFKSA